MAWSQGRSTRWQQPWQVWRLAGSPGHKPKALVDSFVPPSGLHSRSLYRALVGNGLLMESPDYFSDELMVQFGYEWFADYFIAKHIINSCGDADDVACALAGDDPSQDRIQLGSVECSVRGAGRAVA